MTSATRVWLSAINQKVPVYHQPDSTTYTTRCGEAIWRNHHLYGVFLRIDHAEKIGRPCKQCAR